MQEPQAAGPAREAPQRRAARGGRLQAGLRRRQAAAAAAAAAAEEDSDDPGHDTDGEVTSTSLSTVSDHNHMLPAFMSSVSAKVAGEACNRCCTTALLVGASGRRHEPSA